MDAQRGVLLKKEYTLSINGKLNFDEVYECTSIQFSPGYGTSFIPGIGASWKVRQKDRLGIALLKTKF